MKSKTGNKAPKPLVSPSLPGDTGSSLPKETGIKLSQDTPQGSSALKVNKGIPQPPVINETAARDFRQRLKTGFTVEDYLKGIQKGDRVMLSRAITLIESALPAHQAQAQQILERCMPLAGNSLRIGITGVPGVGKSTFIEAFGTFLTARGHRLAVLAIDPSSAISKGSILGDKTRMEKLSTDQNAFVRPSPSAGSLGGVARKTREIIVLCEAAGYDIILIETVGVGQSEIAVHSMVDFFLLLMLSGAGDELQGIKRGIIEMCDGMAINKADGDNLMAARRARSQYAMALHMFPPSASGWVPRVETCSAITRDGIDRIWDMIGEYTQKLKENGYFQIRRNQQHRHQMLESIHESLRDHFYAHQGVVKLLEATEKDLAQNKLTPYQAAGRLLGEYFKPPATS